jgi:hypothetical protein
MLIERSLYPQISGDEPLGEKGRVDESNKLWQRRNETRAGSAVRPVAWDTQLGCLNIPKGEEPERHVHLEGVEIHFILLEPMF